MRDDLHVRVVQLQLLVGGRDADDFGRARRQFEPHAVARAAQQDRASGSRAARRDSCSPAPCPSRRAMRCRLKKRKPGPSRRSSMNCTTEYRSSSRFSSGVPDSTSANRELQALDDAAGLRFPVLDPLAFVENDQVPLRRCSIDQDVAQHLLVVADGEEAVVRVLRRCAGRRRRRRADVAVAEALDFAAPLRLERGRTDDEHLA